MLVPAAGIATLADRDAFVAERRQGWEALERLLARGIRDGAAVQELSRLYRAAAADLATAQSQDLPEDVIRYLDALAGRAHNQLYGTRQLRTLRPVRLLMQEFPRELRANAGLFLLANLLFYGPFLVGMISALIDPAIAEHVVPASQLELMEQMYSEPTARGAGEDAQMAGFYVSNNIGIAFRTFATGVFGGLGSLFFLIYNGAFLGTIFGYLFAVGRGFNLAVFTAGHSAWELTGIVVSGTAGLRMGWALVVTEGRTRAASLRASGPAVLRLVLGAAAMILIAAAIEGFWSASPVPWFLKLAFGAFQVPVVLAWLGLAGR